MLNTWNAERRQFMKRKLLFVAYINEDFDAGLTYAAELARLMEKDLDMLVIKDSDAMAPFERMMTAITFAEENEHDTALEWLEGDDMFNLEEKIIWFREKCNELGIDFSIHSSRLNMLQAIDEFMNQMPGIDMVLLGPSVTDNGNITSSDLNRLVRNASRPIVKMNRQVAGR